MHRHLWAALVALITLLTPGLASAAQAPAPPESALADHGLFDRREAEEEEISEAEAEENRKKRAKAARVVVLQWPDTSANYQDQTIQRIVINRIDRPDALFFPSEDLYQNGRRINDPSLHHTDQPATVPAVNLQVLLQEASAINQINWSELSPGEWGIRAEDLASKAELLWFVENDEQREVLFVVYAAIGYAAENSDSGGPPLYEGIGGRSVNYYHYLAATLAAQDDHLMALISSTEVKAQIQIYIDGLKAGEYPQFPLDFERDNQFDLEAFDKEYTLYINGMATELNDEGQLQMPLSRVDIFLERKDAGYGLSERIIVDKFEDKTYFVRNDARKKMGLDFIEELFRHPNECNPELSGDILDFLAIYAELHKQAEIYIAVPRDGDVNRTWIWRYDRDDGTLSLVTGGDPGFPIRFAVVASSGLLYNGGAVNVTPPDVDPNGSTGGLYYDLKAGGLPIDVQLRLHYNHLLLAFGMEHSFSLGENGAWSDRYYTPLHAWRFDGDDTNDPDLRVVDANSTDTPLPEVYHYRYWNRHLYARLGWVFGQGASLGYGPRLTVAAGTIDVPHVVPITGHFGWAIAAPIDPLIIGERIRPIIDIDLRVGPTIPLPGSASSVGILFGMTAGVGTTF